MTIDEPGSALPDLWPSYLPDGVQPVALSQRRERSPLSQALDYSQARSTGRSSRLKGERHSGSRKKDTKRQKSEQQKLEQQQKPDQQQKPEQQQSKHPEDKQPETQEQQPQQVETDARRVKQQTSGQQLSKQGNFLKEQVSSVPKTHKTHANLKPNEETRPSLSPRLTPVPEHATLSDNHSSRQVLAQLLASTTETDWDNHVRFKVSWDLHNFFAEQYNGAVDVGSVVILCGTYPNVETATCREYLIRQGPRSAQGLLSVVNNVQYDGVEKIRQTVFSETRHTSVR